MFSTLATRALRAPTLARLPLLQRASAAASLRAFTASAAALEPAKAAAATTTTTTSAKRAAAGTKGGRATAAKGASAAKPKAAAGATKAKAKAPAKKPAAKKAAPKPKKAAKPKRVAKPKPAPKPKVTEADKPPKRPLSAFLRFMAKYRAGAGPVTTAADVQEQAKAGGAVWRAMSAHEQQAFKDEYTGALPAYAAAFAAWSAGVDPAKLRLLNAKRRARGKSVVRRARGAGPPATPYMRFLAARPKLSYPPGADIVQRRAVFAEYSRANGAAWTAASDAEKKPYRDAYEKESIAYRAEQASLESASASA